MFEQKYNLSNAVHPGGGGEGGKGPRDTELDIFVLVKIMLSVIIYLPPKIWESQLFFLDGISRHL